MVRTWSRCCRYQEDDGSAGTCSTSRVPVFWVLVLRRRYSCSSLPGRVTVVLSTCRTGGSCTVVQVVVTRVRDNTFCTVTTTVVSDVKCEVITDMRYVICGMSYRHILWSKRRDFRRVVNKHTHSQAFLSGYQNPK